MTVNNKELITQIDDFNKKNKVLQQYFCRFLSLGRRSYIEALESFSKHMSYTISDFETLYVQDSFEEWEQEYDLLEGRKVGLSMAAPAQEKEVFLIMSFEEFYGHLVDTAKLVCEKYPEVENEVYEKLEKVRIALDVKKSKNSRISRWCSLFKKS